MARETSFFPLRLIFPCDDHIAHAVHRELGSRLAHVAPEDIRPVRIDDFEASIKNIRPSVTPEV
jgi:hypothetical protein